MISPARLSGELLMTGFQGIDVWYAVVRHVVCACHGAQMEIRQWLPTGWILRWPGTVSTIR